jgi:ascorbate-specific PTS system EIIC-type component UlaA
MKVGAALTTLSLVGGWMTANFVAGVIGAVLGNIVMAAGATLVVAGAIKFFKAADGDKGAGQPLVVNDGPNNYGTGPKRPGE